MSVRLKTPKATLTTTTTTSTLTPIATPTTTTSQSTTTTTPPPTLTMTAIPTATSTAATAAQLLSLFAQKRFEGNEFFLPIYVSKEMIFLLISWMTRETSSLYTSPPPPAPRSGRQRTSKSLDSGIEPGSYVFPLTSTLGVLATSPQL